MERAAHLARVEDAWNVHVMKEKLSLRWNHPNPQQPPNRQKKPDKKHPQNLVKPRLNKDGLWEIAVGFGPRREVKLLLTIQKFAATVFGEWMVDGHAGMLRKTFWNRFNMRYAGARIEDLYWLMDKMQQFESEGSKAPPMETSDLPAPVTVSSGPSTSLDVMEDIKTPMANKKVPAHNVPGRNDRRERSPSPEFVNERSCPEPNFGFTERSLSPDYDLTERSPSPEFDQNERSDSPELGARERSPSPEIMEEIEIATTNPRLPAYNGPGGIGSNEPVPPRNRFQMSLAFRPRRGASDKTRHH